jgi:hypothetical protein
MNPQPQTLGAYYQCHKNAASFIRTVKSFKHFYPESDMVIINDGGYDYEKFCNDNRIYYNYIEKIDTQSNALLFNSPESCIQFLKHLFTHLEKIKDTHVLLLEDDVRVMKKHTQPFLYSINGCNKFTMFPSYAIELLKKRDFHGPFYYGGCGGCVLNKQFFQSIDFKEIEKLIYIIKHEKQMFASDLLLSFITLYFGGTIGQYDEFAETWYSDIDIRINNNSIAFLHQYKTDYEKNGVFPTEEEKKELYFT